MLRLSPDRRKVSICLEISKKSSHNGESKKMAKHKGLLSTASEIQELVQVLDKHSVIAFDTEFIRESTFFPIVEIVQVATLTDSWLIDVQAFRTGHQTYDPSLEPLLKVFANQNILKIVHAAQGDQECLYTAFGIVAKPTLDTAIAASLCGFGDSLGLGKLLKLVLDVSVTKGHARTHWSVRPLPEHLQDYAHVDVEFLVQLGLKLSDQLDHLGRLKWAMELSSKWENKALYESDIEGIAQKLARGGRIDKKGYRALLNLVQWREDRVRHLNLPRRWLADDQVLLDLAHVRPKDLAHLSSFRGLNKGEIKNHGHKILEILKLSSDSPEDTEMPRAHKAPSPNQDESQAIDLLRCYLNILADEHKISAKHLLSSDRLLTLLRNEVKNCDDLIRLGVLTSESSKLIGEELIAMLHGRRALSLKGTRISTSTLKE